MSGEANERGPHNAQQDTDALFEQGLRHAQEGRRGAVR